MNLPFKLGLDHYLGGPLSWGLNLLAKLLAKIWRRDHTLSTPPRAILFMKFMGLGSIARSAFLLEATKKKFPQTKLYYATFSRCSALPALYPQINSVYVIRDEKITTLLVDSLRFFLWAWQHKIDLVVDLEVHSKYSSIMSAGTLACDRAGFATVTSRFRRGLYTHLVFWNPTHHVDSAYEQLGRAIGLTPVRHAVVPKISPRAQERANALLEELNVLPGQKLIGINPHTSELRSERQWPLEYFFQTIAALASDNSLQIFLLGAGTESIRNEEILKKIDPSKQNIHNAAGKLSFKEYLALLSRLSFLLTNDSAPLHLAEALNIQTLSLWGPTDPAHLCPPGKEHLHIYRSIYCSPCTHTTDIPPCGGDNQCLKQISWQEVTKIICKALQIPIPIGTEQIPTNSIKTNTIYGYWRGVSVPIITD